MPIDPTTAIALIAGGLKLIDQFYDLTKKVMGQKVQPHSVEVEQDQGKLTVTEDQDTREIHADDLKLGELDQIRHDTLQNRININWRNYNGIYEKRAAAAPDEDVRLGIKMDEIKIVLCGDFRELVTMYEKVLNTKLPDHYTLFDICP